MEAPLVVLALAVVLSGPILAIIALLALRRLESDSPGSRIRELTSRIHALEQVVGQLRQPAPAEPAATSGTPPGAVWIS